MCGVGRLGRPRELAARMTAFGPAEFQDATSVSRETIDRLSSYVDLLQRWQARINLVSRGTLNDIWHRHIYDSAQLIPHLPDQPGNVADFGSGAGLPGLILSIIKPEWHIWLIESDAKKAAFLREAARIAGASAEIAVTRLERAELPKFDVVLARALAPLTTALGYAYGHLAPHGICVFHKGVRWREELTEAQKRWHMKVDVLPSHTNPQAQILRIIHFAPKDGSAASGQSGNQDME